MLQFLNLESMKKTEPFCSGINVLLYYSSKKLESFKWQLKTFKRTSKFKAFRELHNQDIPSLYACIYSMYACVRERNKVHFTVLQQNFLFLNHLQEPSSVECSCDPCVIPIKHSS